MLAIRLNRFGKRNQAHFRVVLQEKTKAPGHRHIEMLGSHNPHSKETLFNKERILYWIGQGAQPSDRVHNMLVTAGVIEGKKIAKRMPRPVKKEAESSEPVELKPKAEEVATPAVAEAATPEAVTAPEVAAEAAPAPEAVPVVAVEEKKEETPVEAAKA